MAADATDRIRNFIQEEILFDEKGGTLADDTPLLPDIIDSLGLTQVVAFLEKEFDLEIDDSEMSEKNFGTIADINRLVMQKLQ